jgi:hypothetical protein
MRTKLVSARITQALRTRRVAAGMVRQEPEGDPENQVSSAEIELTGV